MYIELHHIYDHFIISGHYWFKHILQPSYDKWKGGGHTTS